MHDSHGFFLAFGLFLLTILLFATTQQLDYTTIHLSLIFASLSPTHLCTLFINVRLNHRMLGSICLLLVVVLTVTQARHVCYQGNKNNKFVIIIIIIVCMIHRFIIAIDILRPPSFSYMLLVLINERMQCCQLFFTRPQFYPTLMLRCYAMPCHAVLCYAITL